MRKSSATLFIISIFAIFSSCLRNEDSGKLDFKPSKQNALAIVSKNDARQDGFLFSGPVEVSISENSEEMDTIINWTQYKSLNNVFHFCVPSSWVLRDNDEAEFLFVLDTIRYSDYFALTTNAKSEGVTTPREYAQYVIDGLRNDHGQNVVIHNVEGYRNNSREVYYFEVKEENGPNYFVLVTESEGFTLDFTMRFSEKDVHIGRMMFQWAMGSFLVNGSSVMGLKARLESVNAGLDY